MEELIDWQSFNNKNSKNIENAFEKMCYYLFSYKFNAPLLIKSHNNPGIETEPILFDKDKKYYGFQSKYFKNKIDYKQILKSIKSLKTYLNKFDKKLDYLVLYCNQDLTKTSVGYSKIIKKLKEINVELIEISNDSILKEIADNDYNIVYNIFFKDARLTYFESHTCYTNPKIDEIISTKLIDLNLKSSSYKLSELPKYNFYKKINIILGNAGLGKSVCLYYLYNYKDTIFDTDENFVATSINNKTFNVFFDFKIHSKKYKDVLNLYLSNLTTDKSHHKIQIFFDAIDELNNEQRNEFFTYLSELSLNQSISTIFISCRTSSLTNNIISNIDNCEKFTIEPLYENQKKSYVEKILDENNYELFTKIFINNESLKDVLSEPYFLDLIASNFEGIKYEENTNEIITQIINLKLKDCNKNMKLPLPQMQYLYNILEEVAILLFKNKSSVVSLRSFYEICHSVLKLGNYQLYNEINRLLTDSSILSITDNNLYFTHKRMYEYFLSNKIYELYKTNLSILKTYKIVEDIELFENIFMRKLHDNVLKRKELSDILEYNIYNAYIGNDKLFGFDLPAFMLSDWFYSTLNNYDDNTFCNLIENNNLIKKVIDVNSIFNTKYSNIEMEYGNRIAPIFNKISKSPILTSKFNTLLPKEISVSPLVWLKNKDFKNLNSFIKAFMKNFEDILLDNMNYNRIEIFSQYLENAFSFNNSLNNLDKIIPAKFHKLFAKAIFCPNLVYMPNNERIKTFVYNLLSQNKGDSYYDILRIYTIDILIDENELLNKINKTTAYLNIFEDADLIYASHYFKWKIKNYDMVHFSDLLGNLLNKTISTSAFIPEFIKFFNELKHRYSTGICNIYAQYIIMLVTSKLIDVNFSISLIENLLNFEFLNIQLLAILKEKNRSIFDKIKDIYDFDSIKNINEFSSLQERVDLFFQLSYLYVEKNKSKSLYYFMEGYSKSYLYHGWKGDVIVERYLIDSFVTLISHNYFNSNTEFKYICKILKMIEWIDKNSYECCHYKNIEHLFQNINVIDKKKIIHILKWLENNDYNYSNIIFSFFIRLLKNGIPYEQVEEIRTNSYIKNISSDPEEYHEYFAKYLIHAINYNTNFDKFDNLLSDLKQHLSKSGKLYLDATEIYTLSKLDLTKDLNIVNNNVSNLKTKVDNKNSKIDYTQASYNYWNNILNDENIDVDLFFKILKEKYFPNEYMVGKTLHPIISLSLNCTNQEVKNKMNNYLIENSGYCGLYMSILSYQGNKEISTMLFERFVSLCEVLTRPI